MSETPEPSPWAAELAELLRDATPGPWWTDVEDDEFQDYVARDDITIYCASTREDDEIPDGLATMMCPLTLVAPQYADSPLDGPEAGKLSHRNARLICLLRNHGDEILSALRAKDTP